MRCSTGSALSSSRIFCSARVVRHDLLRSIAAAFVTMAGRATANGFSRAKPHHIDADVPPVPHAAVGQEADALNPSLSFTPPLPHVPPDVMASGRPAASSTEAKLDEADEAADEDDANGYACGPDDDVADADKSPVNVDDDDDDDGDGDDDTDTDTDTDLPLCKLGEEKERKDRARAEREQGQRGKAKRVAGDAGTTTCTGTTTARKGAEGEGPGHDQSAARDLLMSVRDLQKYIPSYSIMNCMPLLIFAWSVF